MPKSESLISPDLGQQQVGRLDVAMDDAGIVGVFERSAKLDGQIGHFAPVESAAGAQLVLQARAADQLHGVEERALFFAIAVQADDVRMPELFQRLDLGLKADAKAFVGGQLRRQHLDGRGVARDGVDAFVNGAHSPLPQLFAEAVGTQLLNLHDRPSRGRNEPRGCARPILKS